MFLLIWFEIALVAVRPNLHFSQFNCHNQYGVHFELIHSKCCTLIVSGVW